MNKKVKSLGDEYDNAKNILGEVQEMLKRRDQAQHEWKQFTSDLENAKAKIDKELSDMRERVLVERDGLRKSMENDLAKERLKGLQDIRAAIQAEEQKYEQKLRLRATETTQFVTERLLPKLDAWIADPQKARLHMGTEIGAAVAQVMLKESSSVRVGEAPPTQEKVEEQQKRIWKLAIGGGVAVIVLLYMFGNQIYPYFEKLAGNSYAMKLIEDRRIQSIYDPPKPRNFTARIRKTFLYMKTTTK